MAAGKRERDALCARALGYPGAREDHPWGERVVKVGRKIFVFLGRDGEGGLSVTAKLAKSGILALGLPFAEPTGYGLGGSGWVTASFGPREKVPMRMMREWIDESYRAVAPRRLVARLDADAQGFRGAPSPAREPARRGRARTARRGRAGPRRR